MHRPNCRRRPRRASARCRPVICRQFKANNSHQPAHFVDNSRVAGATPQIARPSDWGDAPATHVLVSRRLTSFRLRIDEAFLTDVALGCGGVESWKPSTIRVLVRGEP